MLREIKKKMVILNNRGPFKQEIRDYLRDLELSEWVFMNLRLSGSRFSKEDIAEVLQGGWLLQGSVEEHLLIERLQQIYRYMYQMLDMKSEFSLPIMFHMHQLLSGGAEEEYRKNNPVLLEYRYNPMMPAEIPAAMEDMLRTLERDDSFTDPFSKAVQLHNRIIEIYPYKQGNEHLARAAMYYTLAAEGYPMAAIVMSEQEYNDGIIAYLKKGESGMLCQALTRAVYNRLELMIQITGYDDFGL